MKRVDRAFFVLAGALFHLFGLPGEWFGRPSGPSAFWQGVSPAFAEVLERVEDVLRRSFPTADSFREEVKKLDGEKWRRIEKEAGVTLDPLFDRRFFVHIARSGDAVLGYAIEDTVRGKWGPIHYLLTLDPAGRVLDVTVLEYRERRGAPVAKRRFLSQFIGKRAADEPRLQRDIQGITGASISSRGMTDGVRKLLHVFGLFYASS